MTETRAAPADTAAAPAPVNAAANNAADPDAITPAPGPAHALTNDRAVAHSDVGTPSAPSAVSASQIGTYTTPVIPTAHAASTDADHLAVAPVSPATSSALTAESHHGHGAESFAPTSPGSAHPALDGQRASRVERYA